MHGQSESEKGRVKEILAIWQIAKDWPLGLRLFAAVAVCMYHH